MPKRYTAMLACPALFLAGGAIAAPLEWNLATVALPDGSVAEIEYVGDIPPRVTIAVPVVQDSRASGNASNDAIPAARRVLHAPPPSQAVAPEGQSPERFVRDMPAGSTYEYTLITTRADGKVCDQKTEWTSRGPGNDPSVRRIDTGEGCAAVAPPPAPRAPNPPAPAHPPVRIDPDAV